MANNIVLIVGMGFGNAVYRPIYQELGFNIVTVDLYKDADFNSLDAAIKAHKLFNVVHICTPNYTHEELTRAVAPYAEIVFVEKPGVANHTDWAKLVKDHIDTTRIVMVKNNQYREEIDRFKNLLEESKSVKLNWTNQNRIPNPGSWFTTKELAFGGVSRDLIPHMLSYFTTMTNYFDSNKLHVIAEQRYTLEQITNTDYGKVDPNGIFDVDDYCSFKFVDDKGIDWDIVASWKNDQLDDSSLTFILKSGGVVKIKLGLCPESAYKSMIVSALDNKSNDKFWKEQYEQDMWIHRQVEKI
jgi:predicted dehydrogenase